MGRGFESLHRYRRQKKGAGLNRVPFSPVTPHNLADLGSTMAYPPTLGIRLLLIASLIIHGLHPIDRAVYALGQGNHWFVIKVSSGF